MKFRKYWDAELRASVYLNEFLTETRHGWSTADAAALDPESRPSFKQEQGRAAAGGVIEVSDEREERFLEIVDQRR